LSIRTQAYEISLRGHVWEAARTWLPKGELKLQTDDQEKFLLWDMGKCTIAQLIILGFAAFETIGYSYYLAVQHRENRECMI
jgi:hypothetical protein